MSNPEEENEYPSEKAAKQYKDATESIERAASVGAYTELLSLFGMLMKFATDPRIEVVMKFLNLFNKFFDKAASKDAGAIAEALYNEDNIDLMEQLADRFYRFSAEGGSMNTMLIDLVNNWPQVTKAVEDFGNEVLRLTKPLSDARNEIAQTNSELNALKSVMKDIKDINLSSWFDDLLEYFD